MTGTAIVHDGWDPTAELLADAGRRLGLAVVEVDLRHDRLGLRIGPTGAEVRHRGATLRPGVVLNRSSVTGLGLASSPMLERQRPHGWDDRHVAARQEQGVLLAVFDAWARSGATVLNPTTAEDLSLMPNAVIERLRRRGVPLDRRATAADPTEVLVANGRGVAHRGSTTPTRAELATALSVAECAGFAVGTVSLHRHGDRAAVTAWDHRPDLTTWPGSERLGLAVWSTVVDLDPASLVDSPPRFFVDEL